MIFRYVLIVILTSLSSTYLHGQIDTIKTRIRFNEFNAQVGLFSGMSSDGSINEFRDLLPESVLLKNDLTAYSQSYLVDYNYGSVLSANVGMQFRNKQKSTYNSNRSLRLGLTYFSGGELFGLFNYRTKKRFDTLTSNQSGQSIYVDSLISKSYAIRYISEQIRLDGSFIFRTNSSARFSMYGGIGFSIGASVNRNAEVLYNAGSKIELNDPFGTMSFSNNNSFVSHNVDSYESERFRMKNSYGFSGYIPLGIDFTPGKYGKNLNHFHVFYELRPGINYSDIPESRSVTTSYIQHGWGVRVTW